MSTNKKRPPFEGLYIYIFLLLIAFIISDLALLKTQLFLEEQNNTPARGRPGMGSPRLNRGMTLRENLGLEKYRNIIARNLFNADGIIPPPKGATEEESFNGDEAPVPTDLPIQVVGTIVHANPYRSIASVQLQGEDEPEALKVGDQLKDLAEIMAVFRRRLVFRNLKNQRLEYAEIPEDPVIAQRRQAPISKPTFQRPTRGNGPSIQQQGNNFTLNRRDVISQLSNYNELLRSARAIPYQDPATGEPIGFKVTNMMPGSLFQQLGIRAGDVIKGVNGESINTVNKALEVFQNLKGSVSDLNSVNITIERNGSEQNLNYNVE